RPEAVAAAGELRGFVAEIEDIVAQALLPVLLPEGAAARSQELALAASWAAGIVGLVRGSAERWVAARQEAPATQHTQPSSVEHTVGAMERDELTEHITTWLWQGAGGVGRRA